MASTWSNRLISVLKDAKYCISNFDAAVVYRHLPENKIFIACIYVDDILCVGPDYAIKEFEKVIKDAFIKVQVERDQSVYQYVGYVITWDTGKKYLSLTQPGYVMEIIDMFKLEKGDICHVPGNDQIFKVKDNEPNFDAKTFQSRIMKLMYLCKTRPDIKPVLTILSTRMLNPTRRDHNFLIQVAKYVNKTKELGMIIQPDSMAICCSADASFGVYPDGKGQTGGILQIGTKNAPFHFSANKQKTVAASSAEAEMIALTQVAQEALWAQNLLRELGYGSVPVEIEQDNKSCILLSHRGPGRGGMSKYINIKYFWVKQHLDNGTMKLVYVPSKQILADALTKPAERRRFEAWRDTILNWPSDTG